MVKGIMIDIGNVLIKADDITIKNCFENLKNDDIKDYDKIHNLYRTGKLTTKEFYKKICKDIISFEKFKEYWNSGFEPIPEMVGILEKLKKKYKTLLLSDTNELHIQYLEEKFSFIRETPKVLSYREHVQKPHIKMYKSALKKIKLKSKECLVIDDKIENIIGAIDVGIHGLLFESVEQLKKDFEECGIEY